MNTKRTLLTFFTLFLFLIISCNGTSAVDEKENDDRNDETYERPVDLPGFFVEGRHIYDRCGEEVILRGINRMTIVLDFDHDEAGKPVFNPFSLEEIAKTGANSVRIMWMMWRDARLVEDAVVKAIELEMIPILEMHDATGNWSRLEEIVDYWLDELLDIVKTYEQNLIVNIANEAGNHQVTDSQFIEGYTDAIERMRSAGIRTPLMIDAAGWGRNVEQLLRTAPRLIQNDPDRNLIFSWHPWDTGENEALRVTNAMEKSVAEEIPFVIGEFSHTSVGCVGEVPYHHIMAEAQRLGIGWLAWSWGPGNGDCETMDMTTDASFESLFGWGLETAVTDVNSIMNTSLRPHSMITGQCRDY
jgi:mannan endo-1,4-beta-mannosidase